jgi:hypothetical protein
MKIAFATSGELPGGWDDDQEAARLAGAEFVVWDDPTWSAAVGPERLLNPPDLVAFDADKRYLGELRARTAPTTFVGPGDPLPELSGEVVVKPNVSAGGRRTGRFGPATHGEATALIEPIRASGDPRGRRRSPMGRWPRRRRSWRTTSSPARPSVSPARCGRVSRNVCLARLSPR